jgi:hypothetical protein
MASKSGSSRSRGLKPHITFLKRNYVKRVQARRDLHNLQQELLSKLVKESW